MNIPIDIVRVALLTFILSTTPLPLIWALSISITIEIVHKQKIRLFFFLNSPKRLHKAAKEGNLKDVKCLLNRKVDVNSTVDDIARTALHHASGNGHFKVVQCLLKHGASPHIQDKYKRTPLHLAISDHSRFFEENAVLPPYLDVIQLLIEHKASMQPNQKGNTPLHTFISDAMTTTHSNTARQEEVILHLLLSSTVHIDHQNKNGLTALHLSVIKSPKITRLLLKNGARHDLQDKDSNTPLETLLAYAKMRRFPSTHLQRTVQLLIERGANSLKNNTDLLDTIRDLVTREKMKAFRKKYYEQKTKGLNIIHSSLEDGSKNNQLIFAIQLSFKMYTLKHMLIRLEKNLWNVINSWHLMDDYYANRSQKEYAFFNAQTAIIALDMDNIRHLSCSAYPSQEEWFRIEWLDNNRIPGLELTSIQMVETLCNGWFPPELLEEIRWFRWQIFAEELLLSSLAPHYSKEKDYKIIFKKLFTRYMSDRSFEPFKTVVVENDLNSISEVFKITPKKL